jgi:hypothetical protein
VRENVADKRCENGHFIDESWDLCPYCPAENAESDIPIRERVGEQRLLLRRRLFEDEVLRLPLLRRRPDPDAQSGISRRAEPLLDRAQAAVAAVAAAARNDRRPSVTARLVVEDELPEDFVSSVIRVSPQKVVSVSTGKTWNGATIT